LKATATYEQADIAEAVDMLDDEQQKTLATLVREVHSKLVDMKVESVKQKEKKWRIPTEQKLTKPIIKIQQALTIYERTDAVEEWNI
jgi:hypothetical protein